MKAVKVCIILWFISCAMQLFAQDEPGGTKESPAQPPPDPYPRDPLPYPHIREADVVWSKVIWRRIDMRQKFNLPFYYPFIPKNGRKNFITVIKEAIKSDFLTVYEYNLIDDHFSVPLSIEDALAAFADSITIKDVDKFGNEITVRKLVQAETQDIYELDIKEIWFLDRERSVLDVRIIGICPVWYQLPDANSPQPVRKPLFWIYYPAARKVLVNSYVFNRHNDVERLSYDDLFAKRMFDSYIYKESNVYDRLISDYAVGIEALIESQRIKRNIRGLEMDLWEY